MDYKISDVILKETVDLSNATFNDKINLFNHMVALLYKAGRINSKEEFLKSLDERESIGTTYMENGVAIPHGKSKAVQTPTIAFCKCSQGVLYESHDEVGTAKYIFMLAIPIETSTENYVRVLARLAQLLTYEDFIDELEQAKNYEEIINAVETTEKLLLS